MKNYFLIIIILSVPVFLIGQALRSYQHFSNIDVETRKERGSFFEEKMYSNFFQFNKQGRESGSLNNVKQKLDSVVTYSVNPSKVISKRIFKFDATGLETESSGYVLDDMTNMLINSSKSERIYNGKSQQIAYYAYTGAGSSWLNSVKYEYTYNAQDLVIGLISFDWNPSQAVWDPSMKTTYSYDANQYIVLVIDSIWDVTKKKWYLKYKTEITNDSKGQGLLVVYSKWNTAFNQWDYEVRDEFTYNQAGKQTSFTSSDWDELAGDWIYVAQFVDRYNASNKLTQSLSLYWDGTQWVNDSKTDYKLDGNQNTVQATTYNWDLNFNRWNVLFRGDCTYDNSVTYDELLLPFNPSFEQDIYFNHQLNKVAFFHDNSGNFVNDENVLLYYSSFTPTSVINNDIIEFAIVPNPVADFINIKSDCAEEFNFNIINTAGKLVHSQILNTSENISVQQFERGFYYYQVIKDKKIIATGKLILMNL